MSYLDHMNDEVTSRPFETSIIFLGLPESTASSDGSDDDEQDDQEDLAEETMFNDEVLSDWLAGAR